MTINATSGMSNYSVLAEPTQRKEVEQKKLHLWNDERNQVSYNQADGNIWNAYARSLEGSGCTGMK